MVEVTTKIPRSVSMESGLVPLSEREEGTKVKGGTGLMFEKRCVVGGPLRKISYSVEYREETSFRRHRKVE